MAEEYDVENHVQENYKIWNGTLLKLFDMAVRSDCEALALEIARLMPTSKTVEAAWKVAHKNRNVTLAEKLQELAQEKEAGLDKEEQEEEAPVEKYQTSPRKEAVAVVEEQQTLKPKHLKATNGHDDRSDVENASDDGIEELRPRGGQKRKAATEMDGNPKEIGFDVYFEEVKEQLEEENSDLSKAELRDVARDMFLSLPLNRRKKYRDESVTKKNRTS